jgi:transposase-like protein
MEGHLLMSSKERLRKGIFERVKAGQLTLVLAAEQLGVSYRQVKRSYKRFMAQGDAGLVHASRGRASNRCKPDKLKAQVLARYEQRYAPLDLGPTLAAEKLGAEGLAVDHETLRRWLMGAGLWRKRRRRKAHRSWRERRARFGELLQIDGSHHRWFGAAHAEACLMNAVDDATGTTLALMANEETTDAAMTLLWRWIARYGVPQAVYTDKKTVYVSAREPTLEEQLAGEQPLTVFGKACKKLDIRIIEANSPQAKGRVERKHGVFQDRFLKELALRRIKTVRAANTLLQGGFLNELNQRFAVAPHAPQEGHRPVPRGVELGDIFCYEDQRKLTNDWTIRLANQWFQVHAENTPLPQPKQTILVRRRLDGSIQLLWRGRALQYHKLSAKELRLRTKPAVPPSPKAPPRTPSTPAPKSRSPWRQGCIVMMGEEKREAK